MKKETLKATGKLAGKVVLTGTKYTVLSIATTIALGLLLDRDAVKKMTFKELVDEL